MRKNCRKDTLSQINGFLKHVTVIYTDGFAEEFDEVQVTKLGVVIGRISRVKEGYEEFVQYGFIPCSSIKQILTPHDKESHSEH